MRDTIQKMKRTTKTPADLISGMLIVISLIALVLIAGGLAIGDSGRYILRNDAAKISHAAPVGIVLGAGITRDGRPFRELQARLDVAAEALSKGYVGKLVLSGDNRFSNYNEPAVMKRYLVEERGIDAELLQEDFAGRSTYESCERAAKVFEIDRTIIISAESHLPRAIYLCRHFGIEAYGLVSVAEARNAGRREPLARVKALLNIYVRGENTVLGAPINV